MDVRSGDPTKSGAPLSRGPAADPPRGDPFGYPCTRRPEDQKSCWDAACHIGCSRASSCPNAHEPLPAMGKLDPSVSMQILRRGGLRGDKKKVGPKEVDGRVAQL